jgi:hypothetical protein
MAWLKLILQSIMKALHKTKNFSCRIEAKNLTLGDLIAGTYSACGEKGASKILQLAMEAHVIKYSRAQ